MDLIRWHKQEQPIIPHPPDNMKLAGFRDPYIIQTGGANQKWKMLLGSGIEGQGGTLLLYETADLTSGLHQITISACCALHPTASVLKGCHEQAMTASDCEQPLSKPACLATVMLQVLLCTLQVAASHCS